MSFPKTVISVFLCASLFPSGIFAAGNNLNVTVDNPQCQDGVDNDGDTFIDFPADLQCDSLNDDSEAPPPPTPPSGGGGGGADNQPPVIVDFTPPRNSLETASTTLISITFDEYLLPQGGNILIKKSSDDSIFDSISVTGSRVTLTAQRILSTQPHTLFQEGASYYIELPRGVVHDFAGNAFPGLFGPSGWRFSIEDNTPPLVTNVSVAPDATLATLSWSTDEPALSIFFWGTTTDRFSGSGLDPEYSTTHMAVLGDLMPGVSYFYRIIAKDARGNTRSVNGTFTTLIRPEHVSLANPGDFVVSPDTNFFAFTWNNPDDSGFEAVRIVRKEGDYPEDPYDGDSVYEGSGEEANDQNVLFGKKYYYAIFAKDAEGNYSSGAIAEAVLATPETPTKGEVSPPAPVTTPEIPIRAKPANPVPQFSDFDFFEVGDDVREIPFVHDTIYLDSSKNARVALPNNRLPDGTHTVMLTIRNFLENGLDSKFLLRENAGNTSRETVISLESRKGKYPVDILIADVNGDPLIEVHGFFDMRPLLSPAFFSVVPRITAFMQVYHYFPVVSMLATPFFWFAILALLLLLLYHP